MPRPPRGPRAGGGGRIGAEGELAAQQALDAAAGLEDQDNVGHLQADLPADAAAGKRHERGRPPEPPLVANHDDPAAVPHAEHESAFDEVGNDDDALGVGQQGSGIPLAGTPYLVEDVARSLTMTVSRYWPRAGAAAKSKSPAMTHPQEIEFLIGAGL